MTKRIAKPKTTLADFFGLDRPIISILGSKKTFWIMFAVMLLLLLPQYQYYDCVNAVRTSVNVWNALFDGELLNFYKYTNVFERCKTFPSFYGVDGGASYPIGAYFLMAIIDLPLFLVEKIFSCNLFANSLAVIYHKLCLVIISVLSGFLMRAMINEHDPENKYADHAMLFYLSSALFVSSTVNVGQAEAITIFLMLLGVRCYLRDNRIGYVLSFALAVNLKYFALIFLLPLVLLLKEKRSWLHLILAVSPVGIFMLLFGRKPLVSGMVGGRDHIDGAIGTFKVNYFIIIYALLLVYAFIQKPKTKTEKLHSIFTVGFLAYSSFLLFFSISYPYWSVLMIPFGVMAILTSKMNRRLMLWSFYLSTLSLLVLQMLQYPWVFDKWGLSNGYMAKLLEISSADLASVLYQVGNQLLGLPIAGFVLLGTGSVTFAMYFFLIYLLKLRKTKIEVLEVKKNELDIDASIQLAASFVVACIPICIAYGAPIVSGLTS